MGYTGFKKLKGQLGAEGAENPGALAGWIGRKKYGKGKFQKSAAKGKKMRGMKPLSAGEQAAALGGKS